MCVRVRVRGRYLELVTSHCLDDKANFSKEHLKFAAALNKSALTANTMPLSEGGGALNSRPTCDGAGMRDAAVFLVEFWRKKPPPGAWYTATKEMLQSDHDAMQQLTISYLKTVQLAPSSCNCITVWMDKTGGTCTRGSKDLRKIAAVRASFLLGRVGLNMANRSEGVKKSGNERGSTLFYHDLRTGHGMFASAKGYLAILQRCIRMNQLHPDEAEARVKWAELNPHGKQGIGNPKCNVRRNPNARCRCLPAKLVPQYSWSGEFQTIEERRQSSMNGVGCTRDEVNECAAMAILSVRFLSRSGHAKIEGSLKALIVDFDKDSEEVADLLGVLYTISF